MRSGRGILGNGPLLQVRRQTDLGKAMGELSARQTELHEAQLTGERSGRERDGLRQELEAVRAEAESRELELSERSSRLAGLQLELDKAQQRLLREEETRGSLGRELEQLQVEYDGLQQSLLDQAQLQLERDELLRQKGQLAGELDRALENKAVEAIRWQKTVEENQRRQEDLESRLLVSQQRVEMLGLELDEREQVILKRRFGLEGVEAESLEEVGVRLGITRERVRQLQNQALATLRDKMLEE